MKNLARPDLAALIGMMAEGRVVELTDLELLSVVMMNEPAHVSEVFETLLPSAGPDPAATDLLKLTAEKGEELTMEKLQLLCLAEFVARYKEQKGIVE